MPRLQTISGILVTLFLIGTASAQSDSWKRNAFATERFEINGTGGRNNPLRKKLPTAFAGDELFVRYRVQYDKDTIDSPPASSGEFFVFWLDQHEGNDSSTHSGGVPNIGIHVSNNQNKFMIRYSSGGESFSRELEGDREFLVVARLWKSIPGEESSFDQLDLWIDPSESTEFKPDTSVHSRKAINTVNWIGFSTGGKTELEDRISVWDIDWANTWRDILELPPEIELTPAAPKITKMERTVDFDKHVVPILENKCFKCHQGEKAKKDIRLDIHDEVLNLTSPGDAGSSQLFQMVSNHEMPPEDEEPLSDAELEVLQKWIDEGLVWNESLFPPPVPKTDHWAFQPVQKPDIPEVKNSGWVRTPVDAFIARKQEQTGTAPAPEATPEILARRLSLDLLGLPPSGDSVSVDELLENPAYGERWGRHWLDVSRWAESNGHQHNRDRPYSWRYRDWVVEAFNNDLPFDRFVLAQLAGDEIESADPDNIIATGFLAAARYSGNEMDKEIQRNDILVDIVNATGSAFLGLTMECAQCHTHKFDPISIRDYYRMKAFFEKGQPHNISLSTNNESAGALVEERWSIFDQTYNRMVLVRRKKGIPNPALVIPKSVVKSIAASEKKRYTELENEIAGLNQTWAFYSPVTAGIPRVVTP
ncbi:MAG: DUF1549 domain-containing protein, partial [Verrucomicrobiales bacterium]|nr:DUF1549 domain-containing protein [Verrucomicrobiales bacterium]